MNRTITIFLKNDSRDGVMMMAKKHDLMVTSLGKNLWMCGFTSMGNLLEDFLFDKELADYVAERVFRQYIDRLIKWERKLCILHISEQGYGEGILGTRCISKHS
jgi:hypothetical protein